MSRHNAVDYQQMFLRLQPPGLAWSRRLSSNWAKLWLAEAEGLARVEGEAWRLIREANPLTTYEALEDWERVAGLPDECGALGDTIEVRRADLIAKLRAGGGQTAEYFKELMRLYGFEIAIQDSWPPFEAEASGAEDQVWECPAGTMVDPATGQIWQDWYNGWLFVWEVTFTIGGFRRFHVAVNGPGDALVERFDNGPHCTYFSADESRAGDYLHECIWPDFSCRLEKLKPAQTVIIYRYEYVEVD